MGIKHQIRKPDGTLNTVDLTQVKAIRAFCLECCGWAPSEVKLCPDTCCPHHPFRLGHNPSRKGVGGVQNVLKN